MTERSVEFEWDPEKAASNLRKHRVNFDEAETVFDDPHACIQEDERHSEVDCVNGSSATPIAITY